MAQGSQPVGSIRKHLISLLKVNDNGWNLSLFEDQNEVNTSLCGNCKEVCCDAVKLGCDHDDTQHNEIFALYLQEVARKSSTNEILVLYCFVSAIFGTLRFEIF
eukprot:163637_1